jgi:hypothetical protein
MAVPRQIGAAPSAIIEAASGTPGDGRSSGGERGGTAECVRASPMSSSGSRSPVLVDLTGDRPIRAAFRQSKEFTPRAHRASENARGQAADSLLGIRVRPPAVALRTR